MYYSKNYFSFVCEDGDSVDIFMEYNSCILLSIVEKLTCEYYHDDKLIKGCEEEIKTLERKEKRKGVIMTTPEIVVYKEAMTQDKDSYFLKTGKDSTELTIKNSTETRKNKGMKKFLKRVFSFSK